MHCRAGSRQRSGSIRHSRNGRERTTDRLLKKLQAVKYPLLVLALGLLVLLVPGRKSEPEETQPEAGLETVLSRAEGVGRARVLVSEHGVVVVCEGADDAAVKLEILRAVGSYTGFGSDQITILKMAGQ